MSQYVYQDFSTYLGVWERVQEDSEEFSWSAGGGAAVGQSTVNVPPTISTNGDDERFAYPERSFEESEIVARFQLNKLTTSRGTSRSVYSAALAVRCGTGNDARGYTARFQADGKITVWDRGNSLIGLGGGEVVETGVSFAEEEVMRARFLVTGTGAEGTRFRARLWRDGESEPSGWQFDATEAPDSHTSASSGYCGFGLRSRTTGGADDFEVRYLEAAFGVNPRLFPPVAPRVRSTVSSTVGSLLKSTSAPALESQAHVAFFEAEDDLPVGALAPFLESLAPVEVRSWHFPNPVTSEERLAEYAGSTKLGRMADAYPSAFVTDAQDIVGREKVTAQELLAALFAAWASEFSWFTYKAVPDLRYRKESGSYGGDGSPGDPGVLTVPAIFYPQDRDKGRRLSMRGIVDDILSVFAGTGLVQDSDGDIALRPTYGPDAPSTPDLQLSNSDLFSRSTGDRPDPRRVYNQARGSFRGGEFVDEQQLNAPALALTGAFDLSGIDDETARNRERVGVDDAAFTVTQTFSPDVLPKSGQDTIQVEYTAAIWSASAPDGNNLDKENTVSGTIDGGDALDLEFEVPQVITVPGDGIGVKSDWELTWMEGGVRVKLLLTSTWETSNAFGSWYMAHDLEFDVLGVAYVQSNTTVEVDFGYDLQRDELIDADGNNALQVSQEAYGEREITVSTTAFAASAKQAQELVQALVMHHMEPRIVRRVEQSYSSKYKVLPDHIGRLVELPSTEQILVEQRAYADDYSDPLAPQLQSTWQGTLTQEAFTTDGLLAFDSGDLLRFEDGGLVKET